MEEIVVVTGLCYLHIFRQNNEYAKQRAKQKNMLAILILRSSNILNFFGACAKSIKSGPLILEKKLIIFNFNFTEGPMQMQ